MGSSKMLIDEIDRMGGSLECIKSGYQQSVIHESAWKNLKGIEDGSIGVIGVNKNVSNKETMHEGQRLNPEEVTRQIDSLQILRTERDEKKVSDSLDELRRSCLGDENIMEPLI